MVQMGPDPEDEVSVFLADHVPRECYEVIAETGRIRCLVTGHEMARSLSAVKTHFQGRKFKAKVGKWKPAFDFTQFEPNIVEDRTNPRHFLYCRLTRSTIPRLAASVEAHVNGRRYQNALLLREREGGSEDEDGIDPDQMAEAMRDDIDLMWAGQEHDGVYEGDEDDEDDSEHRGRELVELEKDVFVFQGRNKRRKGGK